MKPEDAAHLLDRLGVLSQPCDLDLLLFFATHPRCLLHSESLAAFLGYELKVLAESLDTLLAAGILERTQTPSHAARLYVLATAAGTDEWLPPVLSAASTRVGRLALRRALTDRAGQQVRVPSPAQSTRPGPRRLPVPAFTGGRSHTG